MTNTSSIPTLVLGQTVVLTTDPAIFDPAPDGSQVFVGTVSALYLNGDFDLMPVWGTEPNDAFTVSLADLDAGYAALDPKQV